MKHRLEFRGLLLLLLSLGLSSIALARNVWYVNGVHGSDSNNCSSPQTACKTIGHAISLASSGDAIKVAPGIYRESLNINISVEIIGSSATASTTLDGGGESRVVAISPSANVTLSRLTVQNGYASSFGAGIYNAGTLTVNNSTVSGNVLDTPGSAFGGGIYSIGTLTINNSTISENSAIGSCRTRCLSVGGAIANSGGTLTINNSTISYNHVFVYNCDIFCEVSGAGIWGSATLQNTIVANNPFGNCDGSMTSNGYNLSSDTTCHLHNTGDLNNTNPKLGSLGNYGGPTKTIPLLSGSLAIDAGNPSGCTDGKGQLLKTDQRGKPRPDKEDSGGCDMGAFERQED
jgi:hypothetical protein